MLALLAAPVATDATAPVPAEITRSLASAQRAVDDAAACLTEQGGAKAQQLDAQSHRLSEIERSASGLWGRQAVVEPEYERHAGCLRSAVMLRTAQKQVDALDRAFALHSAPYQSGVWVGTMPLCGAGPVATRKLVDEFSGEPVLQIMLDKAAAAQLAALTTANVGHQIAVRVDGEIVMEPHINEPILGGSIQVMGSTAADTARLAALLERCAGR